MSAGPNRKQTIANYLAAYKVANVGNLVPSVTYSRGWYTIRNNGSAIGTRHRHSEIEQFTARLCARVKQPSTPEERK